MRNRIFHIIFWLFILIYLFDYFYDGFESLENSMLFSVIEASIYAVTMYVNLFFLIPQLYHKHGVGAYSGGLVLFLAVSFGLYVLGGVGEFLGSDDVLRNAISYTIHFLLFTFITWLYWYYGRFLREQEEKLSLAHEKLKMEMNLLKAQISPHFLFNSLNNIYSLTLSKHDDAPVMVEKLSDILRYLVYEGEQARVPLSKEIQLINDYLDIYRIQRIKAINNIRFSDHGVQRKHQMIPLVLITIVENGFKHGDLKTNVEGYFEIKLEVDEKGQLSFEATNSKGKSKAQAGIG
ncbi:MAG: histidine kinase, partial [Bacteroidota bacterium]